MSSPLPPSGDESRSCLGSVLYGAVLLILAALIFVVILQPKVEPVSAPPEPLAHADSKPKPPPMPKLPLTYPATRTVDASDTLFGVKVNDPYRWLEDGKAPEVKAWLDAQNKVTRSYLDALPGRDALAKRYGELLHIETISAPGRSGDKYFYMKRHADQEKAVLYWRSATDPNAPEHVLIDPNAFLATNNAALGTTSTTLDGKLLAYSLKPNNADEATLYVKDVESGKDLPGEVIDGAKYAEPSWLPDNSGFIYTYLPPADPAHLADRPGLAVVKFHKLGTDPKNDPVLHDKTGDPTKFIGADVSRDGKWLFFSQQNGWDKNDLYYQPLHGEPTAALAKTWKPIVVGKPFLYSLDPWKGYGYILTNEDAPHYRLFKVSLEDVGNRSKWKEIVPESKTAILQGAGIVGGKLVLGWLENVTSKIDICDLDGKLVRHLELPGIGTAGAGGEPDHNELFYEFNNFTTPEEIFQTSVTNPAQKLWARINIPVDPEPYTVEQQFFVSKDGTRVPMFIVHRKDMKFDGTTPFLIYGYGGFGVNQTPGFWAGAYPWLEAGGGFAMVNLRGGGEFGEKWHQDGMLLKKQNVFDDCIGAAEYLIANKYTSPQHLAVRGGSNGGLLAGAMLAQRPDLWRAVIIEVPLLDMVRYDKFGSGKTWIPEYGSPANEEQFKALYAYSPYHHVKKGTAYPAVMFWTETDDDRVDPMHARKMAAAVQAATSSSKPVLVRLETQGGHGGADQVQKTIDRGTDIWGFLIHELGATPPGDPDTP